jgi:DNA-binding IclR family transcriptional regulator
VPLHCSASGKLLLAFLPKASRERLLQHISLTPYTATTLTDRRRLTAELTRIRTNRFATDNEEFHAGLACVAVPIMDGRKRACAALAVHAPVSRMPLARALEYLPQLRRAALAMALTLNS